MNRIHILQRKLKLAHVYTPSGGVIFLTFMRDGHKVDDGGHEYILGIEKGDLDRRNVKWIRGNPANTVELPDAFAKLLYLAHWPYGDLT